MTTDGAPAQPSNADLLAALQAIVQTQAEHTAALGALHTKVDDLTERVENVENKLDQVAQDVMAVKVDTGFLDRHIADFQTWARRHQDNPNAHGTAA